jgi:hypothetical protein
MGPIVIVGGPLRLYVTYCDVIVAIEEAKCDVFMAQCDVY